MSRQRRHATVITIVASLLIVPATAAAAISSGMCSRRPPLAPPLAWPGCCTEWVASKITAAPVASRIRAKFRKSTTRSP